MHGLDFSDILLSAYAPDGGLFVPELSTMPNHIAGLHPGMTLAQVTARVLEPFTGIALADCEEICAAAFLSFNNGLEPALPLVRAGRRLLLETGAGPTLAFKDIGQQVVARLLNHVLGGRGERATIVVETSGDTGPAAIEAVRGCEAVRSFCLYPRCHPRSPEITRDHPRSPEIRCASSACIRRGACRACRSCRW